MGVSISQWRMAIGCYTGGSSTPSQQYSTSMPSSSSSRTAFFLVIIALLSSQIALSPVYSYSFNQFHSSTAVSKSLGGLTETNSGLKSFTLFDPQPSMLTSKQRNKQVKAVTGNRANRGIKIAHWNMGSAHLHNKMLEVEHVVSEHHPHVLGISEANFKRGHDLDNVQLEDYDLILSKTFDNDQLQVSRVACYKHHSMVGQVRNDLMSDEFSSIWLELGLPGKRKFLICQLYRE